MSKQNSWLFTPTCSFPVFFVGNGISISPFLRLKSKSESHSVMSDSLKPYQLYSSWNFSCQNTGVGSLSLLQGILPTQGLNPGLLHCRQNLYQLSHQGSPRRLEWVVYPFSSGSSWPRNQTRVSCIVGGFFTNWAITVKSLQSCPTLCNAIDGSPPGSPVPGILQARTLEWVAISFSRAWKWKVKVKSLSRVRPSATPWTVAFQAPPSMGSSRQEYWSGVFK